MAERKVVLTTEAVGMGFGPKSVHPNYPNNLPPSMYDTRKTFFSKTGASSEQPPATQGTPSPRDIFLRRRRGV